MQFDSETKNAFLVWRHDGSVRKFIVGSRGLYYCNTKQVQGTVLHIQDVNPDTVPTVEQNLQRYNQRQAKEAHRARYFQNCAGLSARALIRMIDSGALKNSPITRQSVRTAIDIWGPSMSYLKGKMTRRNPDPVELGIETITPIPPDIINNHGNIIMGMNIMKVNGVPFLNTVSRVIQLGSCTELPSGDMSNVM